MPRAAAERELAEARAELRALRDEIRSARRRDQQARRATAGAASRAERERDRRLGAASERATKAEQQIRSLDQPLALQAPLAPGDPVEAPALGVRGTIAAIEGDEAEVVGAARPPDPDPASRGSCPTPAAAPETSEPEPAVRVVASASGDVSDELDVRGRARRRRARRCARSSTTRRSPASRSCASSTAAAPGAVRTAVREELDGHPLVESRESESADGATVVHLAGS